MASCNGLGRLVVAVVAEYGGLSGGGDFGFVRGSCIGSNFELTGLNAVFWGNLVSFRGSCRGVIWEVERWK